VFFIYNLAISTISFLAKGSPPVKFTFKRVLPIFLVIASISLNGNYIRSHNFFNKIGNKIITLFFNIINNTTFNDIYCCYLLFKRKLIKFENIKSDGFEQHAEILCQLVKAGKKFYEVPVNYNGRLISEGKKIRFYHMLPIFYQIIKSKFSLKEI